MADGLIVDGVSVATEELYEAATLLQELAREAVALRARLITIDSIVSRTWLGASGAPPQSARAESDIDQAVLVMVQVEVAARTLSWALNTVADGYTWVERTAGDLGRQLVGGIGALAGKLLPGLLATGPGVLAMGAAGGLVLGSRAVPGGLGGVIDRAMGSGIPSSSSLVRENNAVLNNQTTAGLVRNLTTGLGAATLSTMMPTALAATLGPTGVGTAPAANGVMLAGRSLGMFSETPVRLADMTPVPVDASPVGFSERFERIPDTDLTDGAQVIIERYEMPGQPDRFEVYVAGTVTFSPTATDEPWDMTSNIANAVGDDGGSVAAVRQAMAAAGVTPESPVQFTGYSQGGGTVARLAASGEWNAQGLISFGGPTGSIPIPTSIPAVLVEHREDIVPALGGYQRNEAAVFVEREVFGGKEVPDDVAVPAHAAEYYAQTAALMDDDGTTRLADAAARLDGFGSGATSVTSTAYRFERVSDPGPVPPGDARSGR